MPHPAAVCLSVSESLVSADIRPSFRQPCSSWAIRKRGEIFRPVDRKPTLEIGDAQRGIELAQVVHGSPRVVRSAGKCIARGDDGDYHQEARQIPEGLLRP